ncbi:hypothetical protein [Vogesella oryzae]|uniref:hypothetical protein n=1 Tax=Vogesella oryzae TaxID=1735285 RepID=UPI00158212DA|nr:hypothetical protein [Vogesella oryzae]
MSAASAASPSHAASEQAVIVHFKYGSKNLQRLFELEDQLEKAISKAGIGEYDGNEVAVDGSDGYLYMYGPSADRLVEVITPILESTSFTRGATVKKRYGPSGAGVREVQLVIEP